ncbi:hypothetical protein LguiB_007707 [Lonicera macranthoides]
MELQSWLQSNRPFSSSSNTPTNSDSTNIYEEEEEEETNSSSPDTHHQSPKPFSSTSHIYHTSLKTLTPQIISCLAVHHNSLYAASNNQINVFDLTNHTLTHTFHSNDSSSGLVKSITFGNGKIFTAHQDCKIRVWQLTDSKRHRLVSTLPTVKDRLYRSVSQKNYVQVRRHKQQLWIQHSDAVSGLAVNDCLNLMYSVSWDKCLKIWRMSDLKCLESIKAHSDAVNAVVGFIDGTVYTASADGRINVWGRNDGDGKHGLLTTLEKHKSPVNALALSSDGSALFSGGCDHAILVWEKDDQDGDDQMLLKWTLSGHAGAVLCLIYVDGWLISGSSDRTVRIWKRRSQCGGYCCYAVLEGHLKPVKSLAAVTISSSAGGDGVVSVFSGSLDGEIKLWLVNYKSSWENGCSLSDCRKDLVHAIFKLIWKRKALERGKNEITETVEGEPMGLIECSERPGYPRFNLYVAEQDMWLTVHSFAIQVGAGTSKRNRLTSANANALKLSCELLRVFVTEAVQRAATIAEAEVADRKMLRALSQG